MVFLLLVVVAAGWLVVFLEGGGIEAVELVVLLEIAHFAREGAISRVLVAQKEVVFFEFGGRPVEAGLTVEGEDVVIKFAVVAADAVPFGLGGFAKTKSYSRELSSS